MPPFLKIMLSKERPPRVMTGLCRKHAAYPSSTKDKDRTRKDSLTEICTAKGRAQKMRFLVK